MGDNININACANFIPRAVVFPKMSSFTLKLTLFILAAVAVQCNQDGGSYLHDSSRVHDAE